jgi:hypothetical protein
MFVDNGIQKQYGTIPGKGFAFSDAFKFSDIHLVLNRFDNLMLCIFEIGCIPGFGTSVPTFACCTLAETMSNMSESPYCFDQSSPG